MRSKLKCPECGYNLFIKKKDGWHCARKGCSYVEKEEE